VVAWIAETARTSYWYIAVAAFIAIAASESVWPVNPFNAPLRRRWTGNFALYAACLGLTALTTQVESAAGLTGYETETVLFAGLKSVGGDFAVLVAGMLLADLLIYVVHRVEHRVFLLWRFHAVHHSDVDVDVTTGLRHHPGEFILTTLVVLVAMSLMGGPAWLTPVYGLVFIMASLFQHMNAALPAGLDRLLRVALVTPAMHRIHHSVPPQHHDTNFGNVFSFWDRLFGTYLGPESISQQRLTFGLQPFLSRSRMGFHWPWIMPFVMRQRDMSSYQSKGMA
jgi:sterol desaturase/sphingolipid hydroxylase (fatty acid hydroxylase superfamily)